MNIMNVKERILAIKLMNKAKDNPKYAEEIGLVIGMKNKNENNKPNKRGEF